MKFIAEALYTDEGIYEAFRNGCSPEEIAELRLRSERTNLSGNMITPKRIQLKTVYEAIIREYKKETERIKAHREQSISDAHV